MLTEILTFLSAFQYASIGSCPGNLKYQTGINYSQLVGRWYQHSRYPNFLQRIDRCTSVDVKRKLDTDEGFAYLVNVTNVYACGDKDNVLTDMYFTGGTDLLSLPMDSITHKLVRELLFVHAFEILSTDYTNYAIAYNCYDFSSLPLHFNLVWILTRERKPSDETLQVAHNILTENNLSVDLLRVDWIDQDGCDEVLPCISPIQK